MPDESGKLSRFWQELKRRRVLHVVTLYASGSFVTIELVNNVLEPLNLPQNLPTIVIITLAIGFPLTIAFSWIFDVTISGIEKTKPVSELTPEETTSTPNSWKIATYISLMIIVGLVILNILPYKRASASVAPYGKSIAVLPFLNDSPDEEKMYFINGTMESILNNLCKIEDLRVVSRTSVEQYRTNLKPLPEISEEMQVTYILEGSGQKVGDRILLTVQLLDGVQDRHLWSRQYNRRINRVQDLIDIQSEVAQLVAAEIKAIITPEEKLLIEKRPTSSLTAYDFYQKGRDEHFKYWSDIDNKQALQNAEDYYIDALKYDSSFAQAYTGLAWVYRNKYYWNEYFSENFLDSGLMLTDIALSYDDQLADAYLFRGRYYRATGNTPQAIREYDRVIQYNPNDYMGYYYKAVAFSNTDIVECIKNLLIAASLDRSALASHFTLLGMVQRNAGFFELGKHYWQEALKLDGDSSKYYLLLSDLRNYLDRKQEAIRFYLQASALDSSRSYVDLTSYIFYGKNDLAASFLLFEGKDAVAYSGQYLERVSAHGEFGLANMHRIGYAYWMTGENSLAEQYFDQQIAYCERQNQLGRTWSEQLYTYYDLAAIASFFGEKEKAFEYLGEFNQRKIIHWWMVWNLKNDPLFEPIRNTAEFQKIMDGAETKYKKEHERVRVWLEQN